MRLPTSLKALLLDLFLTFAFKVVPWNFKSLTANNLRGVNCICLCNDFVTRSFSLEKLDGDNGDFIGDPCVAAGGVASKPTLLSASFATDMSKKTKGGGESQNTLTLGSKLYQRSDTCAVLLTKNILPSSYFLEGYVLFSLYRLEYINPKKNKMIYFRKRRLINI